MRALWLRRVGFSLLLAIALGFLPYRMYRNSGLHRYMELKAEHAQLLEHNRQLGREALRLRAELDAFQPTRFGKVTSGRKPSDPPIPLSAVERAARDELGLVRPGEVVFQFVQEATR